MTRSTFLSFCIGIITLLLALSPLIYTYLNTSQGYIYWTLGGDDEASYFSWIIQAKEGNVFFKNLYSLDKQGAPLFNPYFATLGLLAKFFNLSLPTIYTLARIVLGLGLLLIAYLLSKLVFKDEKLAFAAFAIICFSSGFYWLPHVLNLGYLLFWQQNISLNVSEALTFTTLLFHPHFSLAIILLLSSLITLIEGLKKESLKIILFAAVLGGILTLTHPYNLLVLFTVGTFYTTLFFLKKHSRKFNLSLYYLALISLAGGYILWTTSNNLTFKDWTKIKLPGLSLFDIFFLNGVVAVPLLFGVGLIARSVFANFKLKELCIPFYKALLGEERFRYLVVVTFISTLLLILTPLNFSRKLTQNLHIPLVLISLMLLERYNLGAYLKNGFFLFAFILIVFPQNLLTLNYRIQSTKNNPKVFLSEGKLEGYSWLDRNYKSELKILAAPNDGLFIPGATGNQVYVGHLFLTNNYKEKTEQLKQFLETGTEDSFRKNFLKNLDVQLLFWDKRAAILNLSFDPENKDYLLKVFENDEVKIYEIKND